MPVPQPMLRDFNLLGQEGTMRMNIIAVTLAGVSLLGGVAAQAKDDSRLGEAGQKALAAAVAGTQRSDANRARDVYRHPVETLGFIGVKPGDTVVELWPGGGWYTEILAPVLREKGKLVAASFDPATPDMVDYQRKAHELLLRRIAEEPVVFGRVGVAKLSPPAGIDLGPPGSADMVVTFRSTHGWLRGNVADQVYKAFFDVLKPGGVLGVEQHHVEVAAGLVDHAMPQAHDRATHLGAVCADDEVGGKQRRWLGHRAERIARHVVAPRRAGSAP